MRKSKQKDGSLNKIKKIKIVASLTKGKRRPKLAMSGMKEGSERLILMDITGRVREYCILCSQI